MGKKRIPAFLSINASCFGFGNKLKLK